MRVSQDKLAFHVGNDISDLEGRIRSDAFRRLKEADSKFDLPVIDYAFLEHQINGTGLEKIAVETGVSAPTWRRIFNVLGLPVLNRKESYELVEESGRGIYGHNTTGELLSAVGGRKGGKKVTELGLGIHKRDEEGKLVNNGGRASGLCALRKGIGIHSKPSDERFSSYGQMGGMALRDKRIGIHSPDRPYLPKILISGYRSDIGFSACSTWEANLARLLTYLGFSFDTHVPVLLPSSKEFTVDFKAVSPTGKVYWFEIKCRPWIDDEAKFRLFMEQGKLIVVSERKYLSLCDAFSERINIDNRFAGWETYADNLRTNPAKYA